MPSNVVKTKKEEKLWAKAKAIAKNEYNITETNKNFYKVVMGIYMKMLKGGRK